jgi:hypothetical protein
VRCQPSQWCCLAANNHGRVWQVRQAGRDHQVRQLPSRLLLLPGLPAGGLASAQAPLSPRRTTTGLGGCSSDACARIHRPSFHCTSLYRTSAGIYRSSGFDGPRVHCTGGMHSPCSGIRRRCSSSHRCGGTHRRGSARGGRFRAQAVERAAEKERRGWSQHHCL